MLSSFHVLKIMSTWRLRTACVWCMHIKKILNSLKISIFFCFVLFVGQMWGKHEEVKWVPVSGVCTLDICILIGLTWGVRLLSKNPFYFSSVSGTMCKWFSIFFFMPDFNWSRYSFHFSGEFVLQNFRNGKFSQRIF